VHILIEGGIRGVRGKMTIGAMGSYTPEGISKIQDYFKLIKKIFIIFQLYAQL